jgi:hypothetical protein
VEKLLSPSGLIRKAMMFHKNSKVLNVKSITKEKAQTYHQDLNILDFNKINMSSINVDDNTPAVMVMSEAESINSVSDVGDKKMSIAADEFIDDSLDISGN